MSWVFGSSSATGNDRLILLALADEANDSGSSCYPGIPLLAKKSRVTERTAQRCLERLVDQREILIHRPERQGRGRFTRYVVLMGRRPELFDFVGEDWLEGCQGDTLPGDVDKSIGGSRRVTPEVLKGDKSAVKGDRRVTPKVPDQHERGIPKTHRPIDPSVDQSIQGPDPTESLALARGLLIESGILVSRHRTQHD